MERLARPAAALAATPYDHWDTLGYSLFCNILLLQNCRKNIWDTLGYCFKFFIL